MSINFPQYFWYADCSKAFHFRFQLQTFQNMGECKSKPVACSKIDSKILPQGRNYMRNSNIIANHERNASKSLRFQTKDEPFDKFYMEWDQAQNFVQVQPIERYVTLIAERFKQVQRPISILDVGCGYGKQAYTIKKKLQAKGVIIDKFYGYDISAPLVEIANKTYANEPNLQFFLKDLDNDEFNDIEQWDAVISFVALHWVNDIHRVGEAIARSLKPQGLLLAMISLQTHEFHELRVKFINTSRWRDSFEEEHRKVEHFYFEGDIYVDIFNKYFETKSDHVSITPLRYNHKDCVEFLGNWIQEARHLIKGIKDEPRKEAIVRAYTSDLIDSFPLGMTKSVVKHEDGSVTFDQYLLNYQGIKQP